jgi:hypothetical protein
VVFEAILNPSSPSLHDSGWTVGRCREAAGQAKRRGQVDDALVHATSMLNYKRLGNQSIPKYFR